MDLRPLTHFLSLAEHLHFGRASEQCHISASTLSRSIRQLEDSVGAALFERDNRTVRLTTAGRRFQQFARDTLEQWELLRHSLMEEQATLFGEISIYCSVTASYSFLYDLLSEFRLRHPRIELKLHTGDPADAIARVMSGVEDMAISARPDHLPHSMAFKPIARTPLLFIAPRDAPDWMPETLTTTSWHSIPMILSESGLARERINHWFRDQGIKPRIYAQVSGNEAIVSMVGLGFGVGVVPEMVYQNSPLADRVQRLDVHPELMAYDVGLCVNQRKLKNPLIMALWSQIDSPPPA
ncbi:HTH-type transcriptional activator IlvY [Larsenimonas rhizosphaerae]|uniref:HTH-type transcriptional activator IlvY n=1 Tax=Larsenimonas rhizosphaerae TaxID=2944682 RepID=A0AA42CW16_9GAMM|nr:HTH-type transcriptional activator IlvY [Larsenimonas rhizosphaerae]MCM2132229.1 HTH-type transcriptional activator IlvY [Larsenimonas rhizosphaerae]MCX2525456.1 HTH-type transcriptional activator IlvY [Larsenimonas rhizosphaerae]